MDKLGQMDQMGPNRAVQGQTGPNEAKWGRTGISYPILVFLVLYHLSPSPISYLLCPISYLISPIFYLLSPISYLQYPISYLLFPVPYLLSSIPYPLFPIAWCFVFLFNTSCIHNPKFLVWFFYPC